MSHQRIVSTVAAIVLATLGAAPTGAQPTTNWIFTPFGVGGWHVPSQWTNGVPNSNLHAVINSSNLVRLSTANGSANRLTFSAGALTTDGFVLNVSNNVNVTGGTMFVNPRSFGSSLITGANLLIDGGYVEVQNGATANIGTGWTVRRGSMSVFGRIISNWSNIGWGADADFSVSGANARFEIHPGSSNWLLLGVSGGNGTLTVSSGGRATTHTSYIGRDPSSQGTVNITGAGSSWTNDILEVGWDGAATLNISNGGGVVSGSAAHIAVRSGSTGAANVTGSTSHWTISGPLSTGVSGSGQMRIADGGSVWSTRGFIADFPGSTGEVVVTGPGSTWTSGTAVYVGGLNTAPGGAGKLTVSDGGRVVADLVRNWNTSTVRGDGVIQGNLLNGGTVEPGNSIGALTVQGNYTQQPAGRLRIELGAAGSDRLDATGAATLAGMLDAHLLGGFTPAYASQFTVMTFASRSGIFDEIVAPIWGGGVTLNQIPSATDLKLLAAIPGDANLDGIVNLSDFNTLAANFGSSGRTWTQGDFTGDGLVNLADFNRLAASFGLSAGPDGPTPDDWSALGSAVPEPGYAALGGMALLLGTRRRRAAPGHAAEQEL